MKSDVNVVSGAWHESHGSWDEPLGELNNILAKTNVPAIIALVTLKGKNEIERISEWFKIVKKFIKIDGRIRFQFKMHNKLLKHCYGQKVASTGLASARCVARR